MMILRRKEAREKRMARQVFWTDSLQDIRIERVFEQEALNPAKLDKVGENETKEKEPAKHQASVSTSRGGHHRIDKSRNYEEAEYASRQWGKQYIWA
jgi:hypothetical protein